MSDGELEFDTCPICGSDMDWLDCDLCGGEGGCAPYQYDPISYAEDDWIQCAQCNGEGGWALCCNWKAHSA